MQLSGSGNEATTGGRRSVANGSSDVTGGVDEGGVEDAEGPVWVREEERPRRRLLLAEHDGTM